MRRKAFFLTVLLLAAVPCLRAQTDSLLREGDRLHRAYRFEEALERYAAASVTASPDTLELLRRRMDRAQRALNLTDFCADPVVIARERFSRKDFFLFYPLKNQSWRSGPNILDPTASDFPAYAPKGGRTVYYSAPDVSGVRNLYVTYDRDSSWSAPELMGEHLLSLGDDVFPMLSEDGKTLTFSSSGFYGMGGFDLYRSTWDEATLSWGEPENLGFPFNSPGDDFLMADTQDGRYTLFASNRNCSRDSVYIYVIEKQVSPTRFPVRDPDVLERLATLLPQSDPARQDHGSAVAPEAPVSEDTRLYRLRMEESRALRDTIYVYERALDGLRDRLSASGDDRTSLSAAIAEKEAALVPLRKQLEEINRTVRRIEQSFLQRGVVETSDRAERELVGAGSSYTFSKKAWGARLKMKVAQSKALAGQSYKIAPLGRFAQDNTLPPGVTYQIRLFTSARHATLEEIKGLNPVYERITSALRYTYSVGLFPTFAEALTHLNPIRQLGFPEAEIVAFIDGRPVPVSQARRAE